MGAAPAAELPGLVVVRLVAGRVTQRAPVGRVYVCDTDSGTWLMRLLVRLITGSIPIDDDVDSTLKKAIR